MRISTKKPVAFLLVSLMLAGLFSSCAAKSAADNTETVTELVTEPETECETEPDTTIRIGDTSLSEFTVIYGDGYEKTAKELAARLSAVCGSELAVKPEAEAKGEREIAVFAASLGATADGLGMDDFRIVQKDTSLVISGGSVYATDTACARLAKIFSADKYKYEYSDLAISYTLPDRAEYIDDISKLALHWEFYFEPPEWMLDFEEKYAAARIADGRLMSSAHRGDLVYYPENSVEGIISAIMMGCDMVEIDPRLTKDGVFVLLHDATLSRTTNFREKAGKNGLPRSENVADWTYDQLMQLNLKEGKGGVGAALTPYKIPTLDEVMKVCAGRILIQLDVKGAGDGRPFWDFEKDIWPLLEKYEIYPQVIFTWHNWLKENNYSLITTHLKKTFGITHKRNIVIFGDQGNYSKNDQMVRSYGFNPCIRLFLSFTDTDYKEYLSANKSKLDSYKGKLRTYANVTCKHESPEFYAELYDAGITFQLVDKAFELCTHIAENFEPTPYN